MWGILRTRIYKEGQGGTIHECQCNVTDTCCLFTRFGCTVHSVKSELGPVETIVFSTNHCMYTTSRACVWIPNEKQYTTLQ